MSGLNFNELAWKSPEHRGIYGYIPGDKYYEEIVKWLKEGTKVWVSKGEGITTTRITFKNSYFDVIVDYYHEDKLISYVFRGKHEYHV